MFNLNNGKYSKEPGRTHGKLFNAASLKGKKNKHQKIGFPDWLIQKVVQNFD